MDICKLTVKPCEEPHIRQPVSAPPPLRASASLSNWWLISDRPSLTRPQYPVSVNEVYATDHLSE